MSSGMQRDFNLPEVADGSEQDSDMAAADIPHIVLDRQHSEIHFQVN